MNCPRCSRPVADGRASCGYCGQKITSAETTVDPVSGLRRSRVAVEAPPIRVGDLIAGRYSVDQALGSGPLGWVFRCTDCDLDIEVGMKMLSGRLTPTPADRESVSRQLHDTRKLVHPNAVRVYGDDHESERLYFTMQLIDGVSARRLLEQRKQFSLDEATQLVKAVGPALDAAHELGLLGVVKPENLFQSGDDWRLTDIGLASALPRTPFMAAQKVAGVERYLAPELLRGDPIAGAIDVYALGVVLGELLTGLPFDPRVMDASMLFVDGSIQKVIARATSARAEDRYPTLALLVKELDACVAAQVKPPEKAAHDFSDLNELTPVSRRRKREQPLGQALAAARTEPVPDSVLSAVAQETRSTEAVDDDDEMKAFLQEIEAESLTTAIPPPRQPPPTLDVPPPRPPPPTFVPAPLPTPRPRFTATTPPIAPPAPAAVVATPVPAPPPPATEPEPPEPELAEDALPPAMRAALEALSDEGVGDYSGGYLPPPSYPGMKAITDASDAAAKAAASKAPRWPPPAKAGSTTALALSTPQPQPAATGAHQAIVEPPKPAPTGAHPAVVEQPKPAPTGAHPAVVEQPKPTTSGTHGAVEPPKPADSGFTPVKPAPQPESVMVVTWGSPTKAKPFSAISASLPPPPPPSRVSLLVGVGIGIAIIAIAFVLALTWDPTPVKKISSMKPAEKAQVVAEAEPPPPAPEPPPVVAAVPAADAGVAGTASPQAALGKPDAGQPVQAAAAHGPGK